MTKTRESNGIVSGLVEPYINKSNSRYRGETDHATGFLRGAHGWHQRRDTESIMSREYTIIKLIKEKPEHTARLESRFELNQFFRRNDA